MSGSNDAASARMAWPAQSRLQTTQIRQQPHQHQHQHQHQHNTSATARQPLGNVSPNVRPGLPPHHSGSKPMAMGSPLKRTFTAALDGPGFKYLKRRRLSNDTPLTHVSVPPPTVHPSNLSAAASRNGTLTAHAGAAYSGIPEILESTPTEPGSPTGSTREENQCSQESAAEGRSFSSLINYDPSSQPGTAPSTQQQQTEKTPEPEPSQQQQKPRLLFQGPSMATLLRLRLQVAMYKVKTDQVNVPFDNLRLPESLTQIPSASVKGPYPTLLSAPILGPTPHSSRMIHESWSSVSAMPSSPPPAGSPERLGQASQSATPAHLRATGPTEAELTSSTVKGRVAEGLLGLRNAV